MSEMKKYLKTIKFEKYLDLLVTKLYGKRVLIYGAGLLFETAFKNYNFKGLNIIGISDKKFEDKIFNMLLHPEEKPIPKDLNKAELLVFKTKRFIKRAKQSKEYTGESYFKTFARTFINKMCDPASLFKRI